MKKKDHLQLTDTLHLHFHTHTHTLFPKSNNHFNFYPYKLFPSNPTAYYHSFVNYSIFDILKFKSLPSSSTTLLSSFLFYLSYISVSSMVVDPPQQWTTRRNSYSKLDSYDQLINNNNSSNNNNSQSASRSRGPWGGDPNVAASDQLFLEIPATPPSEARNPLSSTSATTTTAAVVAAWYASNIGVLLLNKYLLSFYGYRYPIFLTTLHMIACAGYSAGAVIWLRLVPAQKIQSRRQLLKILSLSVIFCFSVVCGNSSLKYIPISFNQAIGATTPFFTAVFAAIITCRREAPIVYISLLPVVAGIVVSSNSEPSFHLAGFIICVGSTAGRALKSVVQGIILTSESEKMNSMNLLMYMAPMAAAILLPFSIFMEGNVAGITIEKAKTDWFIVFLLFANSTVAYLVNLTNFLVTKHTSALTLQVLGNAKAAVAAVVSVLIFRNPVTVMGITGFGVTVMGVVLYGEAKKRSKILTE